MPISACRFFDEGAIKLCSKAISNCDVRQQNLPAALAAVPSLLACSALRAKDALRPAKRELGFAGLGQALRAHLVTQIGFTA